MALLRKIYEVLIKIPYFATIIIYFEGEILSNPAQNIYSFIKVIYIYICTTFIKEYIS